MCSKADVVQAVGDEVQHLVEIELRYTKERSPISTYMASKGWKYKYHLGRHALERDICIYCLAAHDEMDKEFRQKKARDLKSGKHSDGYYMALCGDGQ